jgi:protein associated with RNAse G/E
VSTSDHRIVWDELKFDGSPHRSCEVVDLGTTAEGRWLFIAAGTRVVRPEGRSYDHPCDAITLVPVEGLWTAVWLAGWDPELYVDVARRVSVEPDRVVTIDLDVDVVRRPGGAVEVLDLDEFEEHRRTFGYPEDLVDEVHRTTDFLVNAIGEQRPPFGLTPAVPPVS